MFIYTLILIVEMNSFILSAQNGALRLLWVWNQERGKDILISLPMDSTSSDLPLFRTIERQGFYDEWQECSPMALRSQYEIKTKTSLQWLVDLQPKALSCTRVKIKSYSKYPWK